MQQLNTEDNEIINTAARGACLPGKQPLSRLNHRETVNLRSKVEENAGKCNFWDGFSYSINLEILVLILQHAVVILYSIHTPEDLSHIMCKAVHAHVVPSAAS